MTVVTTARDASHCKSACAVLAEGQEAVIMVRRPTRKALKRGQKLEPHLTTSTGMVFRPGSSSLLVQDLPGQEQLMPAAKPVSSRRRGRLP